MINFIFKRGLALCRPFFLFISLNVFPISEGETFKNRFQSEVIPFYREALRNPLVVGKSLFLNYLHFSEGSKKDILLILPGKGESASKYMELAYDLRERFEVIVYDHRGQGGSSRFGRSHDLIHVDKFDEYIDDLLIFEEKILSPIINNRKAYLIAHSMGGMIASMYLSKTHIFRKAILSSPMHGLKTYGVPNSLVSWIFSFLDKSAPFIFQRESYNWEARASNSRMTTSTLRWKANHDFLKLNKKLAAQGVSNNWFLETLRVTNDENIEKTAKKINTPLLIFSAARDVLINSKAQERFCSKAKACSLINFPDSRHEILQEKDQVRNIALKNILTFFD